MHQQQNTLQYKMNPKKLKPGLVAYYDIRSGNGSNHKWKLVKKVKWISDDDAQRNQKDSEA